MEDNIRDEEDYVARGALFGAMAEHDRQKAQRSGLRPHVIDLIKKLSKRPMDADREKKWCRRLAVDMANLRMRANAQYNDNIKLLNSLPAHKRMVYMHKCGRCMKKVKNDCKCKQPAVRHITLLTDLLREEKWLDTNLYTDREGDSDSCLKRGIRTKGATVESFIYPKREGADIPLDSSQHKYEFNCKKTTFGNRDRENGETIDNVRRMFKESEPLRNDGLMVEIEISDEHYLRKEKGDLDLLKTYCPTPPIKTFPVEQGERMSDDPDIYKKIRCIANYVNMNFLSKQREKLQFTGIKEIIEIIYRCLSKQFTPDWNFMQTQADLLADLDEQRERNLRPEHVANAMKAEAEARAGAMAASWLAIMAKEDFKSWFWSWPVDDCDMNIVAYYDPDAERWRFYKTYFGVFGSLHSIFTCCRISESLVFLLNQRFRILSSIYIDDTSIFSPTKGMCRAQHAFVKFFYGEILGIVRSVDKGDAHYLTDRFELLGLLFQIDELARLMKVGPTEEKKQIANKEALEAADTLRRNRHIPTVQIQKVCGFMNFITMADRFKPGYEVIRPLYIWSYPMLERKFSKENKRREVRHIACILKKYPFAREFTYMNLMIAANAALEVKDLTISASDIDKPRVDIITDLANSEPIRGGGVLSVPGKPARAFRFELRKEDLPAAWSDALQEVAVGEMLTVALARAFFQVEDVNVICRIDNAYAASVGIAGSARHNMYMTSINKYIQARDIADNVKSIYTYVNTHRNVADALTRVDKFDLFWNVMKIEPTIMQYSDIAPILGQISEIRRMILEQFPLLSSLMNERTEKRLIKKRRANILRNSQKANIPRKTRK